MAPIYGSFFLYFNQKALAVVICLLMATAVINYHLQAQLVILSRNDHYLPHPEGGKQAEDVLTIVTQREHTYSRKK
jgi:hypothetical protein